MKIASVTEGAEAKPKNHIVLVDSAFGRRIGFVSAHFQGDFSPVVKPKKVRGRGRMAPQKKDPRQHYSFLWLDEANNRVVLSRIQERRHTDFGMPELMVCIAQEGFDCVIYSSLKADAPKFTEPYNFLESVEEIRGEPVRVHKMTPEQVLEHIMPLVEERKKYNAEAMLKLAQSPTMSRADAVAMIRRAITILKPGDYFEGVDHFSDQDLEPRIRAAQNILVNYYGIDNDTAFPPKPDVGEVVMKRIGGIVLNFSWTGTAWVTDEGLTQRPGAVSKPEEPAVATDPS